MKKNQIIDSIHFKVYFIFLNSILAGTLIISPRVNVNEFPINFIVGTLAIIFNILLIKVVLIDLKKLVKSDKK